MLADKGIYIGSVSAAFCLRGLIGAQARAVSFLSPSMRAEPSRVPTAEREEVFFCEGER